MHSHTLRYAAGLPRCAQGALLAASLLPLLAGSAHEANASTPATCPSSDHPCDVVGGPGCLDVECCKTVCSFDPFCCAAAWDVVCTEAAALLCTPASPIAEQEPGPKASSPASPCDCDVSCGEESEAGDMDPVYLFSGEYYDSVVDLRIKGRGPAFVWARKYRSKTGSNTAQGKGWDFSYDLRVEASGADIVLRDGTGRSDTYFLHPDGTFSKPEFFRQGAFNPDGTFTLTFADTGRWVFNALDASPAAGRIKSSSDRNGNTLTFGYDGLGRLVTVDDTLDTPDNNRQIVIAYNADGFVASVTDFIGRQVTYAYYQNGDAGGSFGDLKSVTTPAVVGTPNGNDFPGGKTTVYTYSQGFTDERLNHNLLTITDPKGQTYLTNIYASTQNPSDLEFDRIVRQIWGDPSDIIDVVYVAQSPTPENHFAVLKVNLNDRVGNVKEYFYDAFNRGVIERQYTGRANPDQPTNLDLNINPPVDPLRPDDPPYFESAYAPNSDSLPTETVLPNGNAVVNTYDSANPDPRSRGNLVQRCVLPGPRGGDQAMICESYEYDTQFGGCCGTNFVTKVTDGNGGVTEHAYDGHGNRTHTTHRIPSIVEDWEYNEFGQMTAHIHPANGSGHRRRDEFTYYASGPQNGYLHQSIVDADGFALTTTYEHDAVGNVVRIIDPRGHDTLYTFNALDQKVREQSPEVAVGAGVRYETLAWYDANNNIVRVDVQNVDEQGVVQPNTHFTTIHEYDILNVRTRTCSEKGSAQLGEAVQSCSAVPAGEFVTTEYVYDANRNRTLVRSPEAVNGAQPANVTQLIHDERDLVFREVRAPGDPLQSSTQTDYDGNRNVKAVRAGIEDAPRVSTYAYDGYNRLVSTIDPMGNVATIHYDANGNQVSTRLDGELVDTDSGSAGNVRMTESSTIYDPMDRATQVAAQHFDAQTQAPIGDGVATTHTVYAANSQVVSVVDDNGHTSARLYDTANRTLVVMDAKGNTTTYAYDANSNRISVTSVDLSDLGSPNQTFVTTLAYDNLDRQITATDNVGSTTRQLYDSRGNPTVMIDALHRQTRHVYDGLSRLTATVRDMDGDGAVPGDASDIVTSQAWDDASRLIAQTDDNGNATVYTHDPLDRRVATDMADCTEPTRGHDVHGNVISLTDANGSVVTAAYDLLNRVVTRGIVPGASVSNDTTAELLQYDGLSRIVSAQDNDSLVTRGHDSLSHVTRETLNGKATLCEYDGVGNELKCTYPGGRIVATSFDSLNRKSAIADGVGQIATYRYVGPSRVERRAHGNGTRTTWLYDGIAGVPNPPGDFGVGRIISTTHTRDSDGSLVDARTNRWDRVGNKTQRKDVRQWSRRLTHDYQYDAVDRLVHTSVANAAFEVLRDTSYVLDGVGNRLTVSGTGTPDAGLYSMTPDCPIADFEMNLYTTTPFGASGEYRRNDDNGNLLAQATRGGAGQGAVQTAAIAYDYRNQMVAFSDLRSGQVHTYAYDVFGRRIARVLDANSDRPQTTRSFYHDWQEIEEQDADGATQATYVYGLYIDEVLNMRRGANDFYFHADDLQNVTAITNAAGDVVERYEYQDYGQAAVLNGTGGPISQSVVGNPLLYNGRRHDPETGWHYYRTRYLDPRAGRFTTRDTIGIWGDRANLGNGAAYVGNKPWSASDPFGLALECWCVGPNGGYAVFAHGGACTGKVKGCDTVDDFDWPNLIKNAKNASFGAGGTGGPPGGGQSTTSAQMINETVTLGEADVSGAPCWWIFNDVGNISGAAAMAQAMSKLPNLAIPGPLTPSPTNPGDPTKNLPCGLSVPIPTACDEWHPWRCWPPPFPSF